MKSLANWMSRKKEQPKYEERRRSQSEYIQDLVHRAHISLGDDITKEESDLRMAQIEALQDRTTWH